MNVERVQEEKKARRVDFEQDTLANLETVWYQEARTSFWLFGQGECK